MNKNQQVTRGHKTVGAVVCETLVLAPAFS